jgi:uncharacterized protein YxjI
MADETGDSNSGLLSKYIVEKDKIVQLGLNLDFKDQSGNLVMLTKAKVLVQRQTLETPDGHVVATVTHKPLSMMPTYEIHEGDEKGPITAIIKQKFDLSSIMGAKQIEIEDPNGQVIANASGNIFNFEFNITTPQGADVAVVTKQLGPGAEIFADVAKSRYAVNVLSKDAIPTNTLLAFLIVVEMIAAHARHTSGIVLGGGIGVIGN